MFLNFPYFLITKQNKLIDKTYKNSNKTSQHYSKSNGIKYKRQ